MCNLFYLKQSVLSSRSYLYACLGTGSRREYIYYIKMMYVAVSSVIFFSILNELERMVMGSIKTVYAVPFEICYFSCFHLSSSLLDHNLHIHFLGENRFRFSCFAKILWYWKLYKMYKLLSKYLVTMVFCRRICEEWRWKYKGYEFFPTELIMKLMMTLIMAIITVIIYYESIYLS